MFRLIFFFQAQNKKLLQLSKDRHLGERDKLQTQVFDLTHRISEQDETIQANNFIFYTSFVWPKAQFKREN